MAAPSAPTLPDKPTDETSPDGVQVDFRRIPGTSRFEVTLPGGASFTLERSRERAVPGLGGLGPVTGAMYELAMEELGEERLAGTIVDLGAGTGIGTRQLVERAGKVIAVEDSAPGAAFIRAFAPRATVIEGAIEATTLPTRADGAILIDTLGLVEAPLLALRSARAMLRKGGRLIVVEPSAYPTQILVPPARRAMAPQILAALLESSGFTLLRCSKEGGLTVAVGETVEDAAVDLLARGADHCARGELDDALSCFDRCAESPRRNVAVQAVLDAVDVLVARGRADDACGRLLASLRRFPDEPRPLAALSQFMVAAGEAAEARLLAEKAANLAPLDPAVLAALAIALQLSRDGEACVTWRRAYNLAPDALEIALPAAASAIENGHPLLAERILVRAMADPGNTRGEALLMRARARIALGRIEDAKLDAKVALAALPDSEEAAAMDASLALASTA